MTSHSSFFNTFLDFASFIKVIISKKYLCLALITTVRISAIGQNDSAFQSQRYSLELSVNLGIPKERNHIFWLAQADNWPNSNSQYNPYILHHVSKSLFQSYSIKNPLCIFIQNNFKLHNRVFLQAGINLWLISERNTQLSDSLFLGNGNWGNASESILHMYQFSIPFGLRFHLGNKFITSIGFVANLLVITNDTENYWGQNYERFSSTHFSSTAIQFSPNAYFSVGYKIAPKTHLNFSIYTNSAPNIDLNFFFLFGLSRYLIGG